MLKILAIGNSFSQDATANIELLCDELYVRNLCIGGCSLERHCHEAESGAANYSYQENGEQCVIGGRTLEWALKAEKWDIVTIQQVSYCSGILETYDPWMEKLMQYIKDHTKSKIVFHQTWAYEDGCETPGFANYHFDRKEMEDRIVKTCGQICEREKLEVIRTGEFIADLRNYDFFNIRRGGISLSRDGYHLSYNYGRHAAASIWIKHFTGKTPAFFKRQFLSEGYDIIRDVLEKFQGE